MMNKRMEKLKIAYDEIDEQDKATLHGVKDSNTLTVITKPLREQFWMQ
jgi:hypothetical protein